MVNVNFGQPGEQVLIIELIKFQCPICGRVVHTIFTQNENPFDWKCKDCGCYFIQTINQYDHMENMFEYFINQSWI